MISNSIRLSFFKRLIPLLPSTNVSNGLISVTDCRRCHNDYPDPDFGPLRKKSVRDPQTSSSDSVDERRLSLYIPTFVASVAGLYTTKVGIHMHVMFMAPARNVLAVAKTEVNLSGVGLDQHLIVKWQGRPVFILHRSQNLIDKERSFPISSLRDPEADEDRAQRPEWMITIGICTHLGCVPITNAGIVPYGAYCPCHGSHFDTAGRVRKGPAPTNLVIPPYEFVDDENLVIG